MLLKGINIFHVNTLGVDDNLKTLPSCRELSLLQSVAGDLIRNRVTISAIATQAFRR